MIPTPSTARRASSSATSAGWVEGAGSAAAPPPLATSGRAARRSPTGRAMQHTVSLDRQISHHPFGPNGAPLIWAKRANDTLGGVDLDDAARDYRSAVSGVDAAKRAAERRIAAAREREAATRETLHAAMAEAARDGMRPVEIQRKTGYTPERVRQILRAAGIEAE